MSYTKTNNALKVENYITQDVLWTVLITPTEVEIHEKVKKLESYLCN